MSGDWLDGKVALAIGGASGIGRGAVDAFIEEGASVAVLDRDEAACGRLRAERPDMLVQVGDATDYATVEEAVAATVSRFGRLDSLLLFAGIFDYYRPLADIDPKDLTNAFDEIFAVNVKSILIAVRAATTHLREAAGSVTLTLSTSSFYPGRGGPLYVASKFAARGLVIALGNELAPEVRVNGVAPGGTVRTSLAGLDALGSADQHLGDAPGRAESIAGRTPLRIAMGPEDHAGSYVFLASDRARGLTGVIVNSDGGMAVDG